MRGAPDYGQHAATQNIAAVTDLGELAARLGSIDTYDRRGNVVWLDDCADGLVRWNTTAIGVDSAIAVDATAAKNGPQSFKLTAGPALGATATIDASRQPNALGKIGQEVSFSLVDGSSQFDAVLGLFDGATQHIATFRHRSGDAYVTIRRANGAAVDLALPYPLYAGNVHAWHTAKLVVDFSADKYVRLLVDQLAWDLSAYELWTPASATRPALYTQYICNNRLAASDAVINVADHIVTQNEP